MRIGLRVDVDTLRGTSAGVPNLVRILNSYQIKASFFFSVGPDNMGRHLWRLLRPAFLKKMFRTNAASLYGWDILTKGVIGSGPVIGRCCPEAIRAALRSGHEIGLHAWDHYTWQARIHTLTPQRILSELEHGYEMLKKICGQEPVCFAAPAWKMTPEASRVLSQFPFRFRSDCRGYSLFYPEMDGVRSDKAQIPTTLPTYDELIGTVCSKENYNEYLLSRLHPEGLNVLAIHAEVEGIHCAELFSDFIQQAQMRGCEFVPLGELLRDSAQIPACALLSGTVPGREGWLSCQSV